MSLSRQEINLRRLLSKCELLCKTQKDDERFPKYIKSLKEMLQDVKRLIEPSNNVVKTYQKRINSIKLDLGMEVPELDSSKQDYQSMRDDLLNVRQRKNAPSDDLDELMKHNENVQNKIAEDMLTLTKSLKEQSQLANKIIRKDIDVLSRSTVLTDQNKLKLEIESTKLAEHSSKAWKCWLWVMLFVVMVVFMQMVLFMKVMKKNY